jgi:hypothetical protein
MHSDNVKIAGEYTECAGKECRQQGVHYLRVLYLSKSGWFCDSCKSSLMDEGLVNENGRFRAKRMTFAVTDNEQQQKCKELRQPAQGLVTHRVRLPKSLAMDGTRLEVKSNHE